MSCQLDRIDLVKDGNWKTVYSAHFAGAVLIHSTLLLENKNGEWHWNLILQLSPVFSEKRTRIPLQNWSPQEGQAVSDLAAELFKGLPGVLTLSCEMFTVRHSKPANKLILDKIREIEATERVD